METKKLSKAEKSWILYDVANSAFILILTATIPIYFRGLTESAGISAEHSTSIWGTSTSIALLILAILSPVLGALADYKSMKKKSSAVFCQLAFLEPWHLPLLRDGKAFYSFLSCQGLDILPATFFMTPCW